MIEQEKWKSIDGYDYDISNFGRIRRNKEGYRTYSGRILKPQLSGRNIPNQLRYMIPLKDKDGKRKFLFIHQLVCKAFNGEKPSDRHMVAHNNGNGLDNIYTNLRWATRIENMADKLKHGTDNRGEKHVGHKLTEFDVRNIKYLIRNKFHPEDIRKLWNVSRRLVGKISSGKAWAHIQESEIMSY